MGGATRALGAKTEANEVTLVAEDAPDLPSDRRIVPVIAPAASHSSPSPGRFERLERFHAQQGATVQRTQQEQHIGGQMRQAAVARLVFAPTAVDFPPQDAELLAIPGALRVIRRQGIALVFRASDLRLQFVNLPSRARLLAIKAAGLQKEGPADLLALAIDGDGCEQRVHTPIYSEHPLHLSPRRHSRFGQLHTEVEHGNPASIRTAMFAQGRRQPLAFLEVAPHDLRQADHHRSHTPLPRPVLIGVAEAQCDRPGFRIYGQAIGLSFGASIVAGIGQHADCEQGDGLHGFVGGGKVVMLNVIVARLLDHILQCDKAAFVVVQALLQRRNSLFDTPAVLACWALITLGADEAFGENGQDRRGAVGSQ